MRRATLLSIVLSIVILGTLLLYAQVPTAKSANFVGQTIYLRADGSIDPSDAPVDVHGTTYTLTGDIQCPSSGYCIYIERSGILLDGYGYTIEGLNPRDESSVFGNGIYLGQVSNVEIRNIVIEGCVGGIQAQSASHVSIHNTTINGLLKPENSEESVGISLSQCDDVNVDNNQLVNNYHGILVQYSNCTVVNNRILDNNGAGVYMEASGITVSSNLIARNDVGIEIQGSNNLIKNNDILSNKRIGVLLGDLPNNVFVENNIAGHNRTGAYGFQMSPYEGSTTFYHNGFANNYVQVDGGDLAINANTWDNGYPSGGNYWDTYHGIDNYRGSYQNETGSDGVGDMPYQITQANVDRYPLMTLFRPIPDIGEGAATTKNDNTLLIVAITVVVVASIIAGTFILYWRRRKKQKPQEGLARPKETAPTGRLLIPVFLTLSLMIILNFAFISTGTYGLGAIGLFGGALYFDEILIGFISSVAAVFVTWKIIIKQRYTNRRLEEILFAAVASFLFVVYLLAYTAYNKFELFDVLQTLQPALVMTWTFATALIGCCVGFLLGGFGLKRMQPAAVPDTQPKETWHLASSDVTGVVIFLLVGFFSGYVFGYISWALFGQSQVMLGIPFPDAAEFPPPLIYLTVWAVVGASVFLLRIILNRRK
jgi:parallel beta-helix repeat protein